MVVMDISVGDRVEVKPCRSVAKSLWGARGVVSHIYSHNPPNRYRVILDKQDIEDCDFDSLVFEEREVIRK